MRSEKLIVAATLFLAITVAAEALQISGVTKEGMSFAGNLISTAETELLLERERGAATTQLGIPLDSIASISLVESAQDPLLAMEAFPHLLDFLDEASRKRLLKAVVESVELGDWSSGYHWTSQLLQLEWTRETEMLLGIYRAWCLFEMGLFGASHEATLKIAEEIDPMEASARFCWLMAHLAVKAGEVAEARKWISLPTLQIPSRTNALAIELQSLLMETGPSRRRAVP
ncbi:MAG: hypothetical protein AB3N64_05415 [Puniceicoccaceae bacterium]